MSVQDLDDETLWNRFIESSRAHGTAADAFREKYGDVVRPLDDPQHPHNWPADRRADLERERQQLLDQAAAFVEIADEVFRRRIQGGSQPS